MKRLIDDEITVWAILSVLVLVQRKKIKNYTKSQIIWRFLCEAFIASISDNPTVYTFLSKPLYILKTHNLLQVIRPLQQESIWALLKYTFIPCCDELLF